MQHRANIGAVLPRTKIQLMRFGRVVRGRRNALGISQEQLAEIADLHRTYIGHIENGRVNISFENIARVARALESAIADLMNEAKL